MGSDHALTANSVINSDRYGTGGRMKGSSKSKIRGRDIEDARSALLKGLSRRQRTFLLEKLVGLNDKEAALAAGYALSVAKNTKQRIWTIPVRLEFERRSEEHTSELQS